MQRAWLMTLALVAPIGCRQVFGIDEPLPGGGAANIDARTGDARAFADGGGYMPGLAMYVEDGATLWTNDEPPDIAWQATDVTAAKSTTWTGMELTIVELSLGGFIDAQHPFSVWMEGQVNLPAGTQQFQLVAADYAFVDLETVPLTGQFQQVLSSRNGMTQNRGVGISLPGWYRVRIGLSATPNTAELDLMHGIMQNGMGLAPFTSANLRH
jgi:hypothetical protein